MTGYNIMIILKLCNNYFIARRMNTFRRLKIYFKIVQDI